MGTNISDEYGFCSKIMSCFYDQLPDDGVKNVAAFLHRNVKITILAIPFSKKVTLYG